MATIIQRLTAPKAPNSAGPVQPTVGRARRSRLAAWFALHWASLCVLAVLLGVVGLAMAWNLQGYPGRVNDDEGTYTAEAWAIVHLHRLAPYTYWYDHPPLGWATIAAWAWLIDGFHRASRAVMVSREVMWLATLASSALLYTLARRLELRRVSAAAGVLLFGLSPLDIWTHRMVSLDNLSTMWALAAFAIAASRRRSLMAAFGSAVCIAAATLSKETVVLVVPALIWLLWQHTEKETRGWNLGIFAVTYLLTVSFYPLFAILRGELIPGRGHVSLLGSVAFQLTRQGSGSLLDPHSSTFALAHSWVSLDPWVPYSGVAMMLIGFFIRRLRPVSLALLLQLLAMVRGGYVPFAFGTGLLPFAALLTAGVADSWWNPIMRARHASRNKLKQSRTSWLPYRGRVPVITALLVFALAAAPHWASWLEQQSKVQGFITQQAATEWVIKNVPRGKIVVCDDYPWLDIKLRSRATPLWLWKIDSDPRVMRDLLPRGYRSIAYMELDPHSPLTLAAIPGRPTLQQALRHSVVIDRFGNMVIYKVTG